MMKKQITFNIFIVSALIGALFLPEITWASSAMDSVNGPLDKLLQIATGKVAKTIATLVIVAAGYATYAGKMSVEGMAKICVATGIIFGAPALMNLFVGAV